MAKVIFQCVDPTIVVHHADMAAALSIAAALEGAILLTAAADFTGSAVG